MKAKEIIKNIKENGGLDINYINNVSRQSKLSARVYLLEYVKSSYDCHGNTANAVVRYFL